MRTRVLTLAVAFLLACGLSSALAAEGAAGPAFDRAKAEAVAGRYFEALAAGNWEAMTQDFSVRMKGGLSPDQLRSTYKNLEGEYGTFVSAAFDRIEAQGKFQALLYRAQFSKGTPWEVKFVFAADDPETKIEGLWQKPVSTPLTAEETEVIRQRTDPVVANYFEALRARDWERATRDFDESMREALPPAKLQESCEKGTETLVGRFVSAVFDRIEGEGEFLLLFYRAAHEKGTTEVKFVFRKADPLARIIGLWEKPLACAGK